MTSVTSTGKGVSLSFVRTCQMSTADKSPNEGCGLSHSSRSKLAVTNEGIDCCWCCRQKSSSSSLWTDRADRSIHRLIHHRHWISLFFRSLLDNSSVFRSAGLHFSVLFALDYYGLSLSIIEPSLTCLPDKPLSSSDSPPSTQSLIRSTA